MFNIRTKLHNLARTISMVVKVYPKREKTKSYEQPQDMWKEVHPHAHKTTPAAKDNNTITISR